MTYLCGAWPARRIFRLVWWSLCSLTLLALPLTIWEFRRLGYNIHYQGWFIGGIFVILSFPISVYAVALHTEYYTRPNLQRYIIRILWMVPIYGVDAWFALRFESARKYLDPIRECYEAFVIYSFYAYLMAYLEETVGDLAAHLSKKPPMQHIPVVRWVLPRWKMGSEFLFECKKGVLNYVIMRPLCTGIGLITDIFGLFGAGKVDFGKSYIYLATATNFSQMWALYCLAMMYHKMHAELRPIRPLSKFIVVKAVVFVTFWQGVALAILVYGGIISNDDWTMDDQHNVAAGIQDFLVCIEMFFAAIAHAYAFPPRDYMDPHEPTKGFMRNVKHMFDLSDVVEDVTEVVENHATTTTTTVLKLPKTAAKAARHMPNNILNLLPSTEGTIFGFGKRTKRSNSKPSDEDDDSSQYAILLQSEEHGSPSGRRHSWREQQQAGSPPMDVHTSNLSFHRHTSSLERPLVLSDHGPGYHASLGSTPSKDASFTAGAGPGGLVQGQGQYSFTTNSGSGQYDSASASFHTAASGSFQAAASGSFSALGHAGSNGSLSAAGGSHGGGGNGGGGGGSGNIPGLSSLAARLFRPRGMQDDYAARQAGEWHEMSPKSTSMQDPESGSISKVASEGSLSRPLVGAPPRSSGLGGQGG